MNPKNPNQNLYDQNYAYSAYPSASPRINGLELIVILVVLGGVLVSGLLGFFAGTRENQDKQKAHDIEQMITALDYFYGINEAYPIRQCSGDLNPVDFELTLRKNLTGQVATIGTQNYVANDFPYDKTGSYTTTFENYIYNIPCPALIQETINTTGKIYTDDSRACNYNRLSTKTERNPDGKISERCYLYTSSINGDRYSIAYFSETQNQFIIYSKFRRDQIQISYF